MATTAYSFNPLTAPTSINDTTALEQDNSDLVSLGDGNSLAVYSDGSTDTLYARKIGPGGVAIGAEALIATALASQGRGPRAAVLANGDIVITWTDNASESHYRIFDQDLSPVTVVLNIASSAIDPDVAALASGGFAIAYTDEVSSTQHDIVYRTFGANGVPLPGPVIVDGSASLNERPTIAGLANGNVAIAYDRSTGVGVNSEMFRAIFSSTGGMVAPSSFFDPTNGTINFESDAAALPGGGFTVTYTDNGWAPPELNITTVTFSASGAIVGVARDALSDDNTQPRTAVSVDGYQVVAFEDVQETADEYGTLIAPSGLALSTPETPLDNGALAQFGGVPAWIDASHVVFTESVSQGAAGSDGDEDGVASIVFDVVRNTIGDSATPLNFSGDGIDNVVTLGSGNDTVFGGQGSNFIVGNGGDDELIGGGGGGIGGSNTIYAFGGNDYLQGGNGSPSDVLVATSDGTDTFYGGTGNNYIVGGTGMNTIVGGGGTLETLYGNGSGGDYIVGGSAPTASNVLGELGIGAAQLWGGPGNNYEVGGAGDDLVVGGNSDDFLFGGNGTDTIYGGNGTDQIFPGPGNDFIWTDNFGSQSTDNIYEGVGTGVDTIADFTPGNGTNHDVLVLTAASSEIGSFADVQAKAFQAGVYTVLPLSATDQIYLYNVAPSQLTANDFIFT